jgi:hypothetical protein
MLSTIERVLKTKVGTSYVTAPNTADHRLVKLTGYGYGVYIVCDEQVHDKVLTRVSCGGSMFMVVLSQDEVNYEAQLVMSVKMMIEYVKKYRK